MHKFRFESGIRTPSPSLCETFQQKPPVCSNELAVSWKTRLKCCKDARWHEVYLSFGRNLAHFNLLEKVHKQMLLLRVPKPWYVKKSFPIILKRTVIQRRKGQTRVKRVPEYDPTNADFFYVFYRMFIQDIYYYLPKCDVPRDDLPWEIPFT